MYNFATPYSLTLLFFLAAMERKALHPDSVTTLSIVLNGDESDTVEWEATAGTTEMQEISALQGLRLSSFEIEGDMEVGEYLGILEVCVL